MNSIKRLLRVGRSHPKTGESKRENRPRLDCAAVDSLAETWKFEVTLQNRCAERGEPFGWGPAQAARPRGGGAVRGGPRPVPARPAPRARPEPAAHRARLRRGHRRAA